MEKLFESRADHGRGAKPSVAELRRMGAIHSVYVYGCMGLSHHLLEMKILEITSRKGEVHERRGQPDHREFRFTEKSSVTKMLMERAAKGATSYPMKTSQNTY